MHYTLDVVQQSLALPNFNGSAAHMKMAPQPRTTFRPQEKKGQPRVGSVLILLYCLNNELYLVLTRRREDLRTHAGQVSFPGGGHEAPESLQTTALREAHEEVGILPTTVTILGQLTPLYILPSDYEVHPFVAWYTNGKRPHFVPNVGEVAEVLEVSLRDLANPSNRSQELWDWRGFEMIVPFFLVSGHKVWGATAMMLSEFLERLAEVSLPR